MLSAPIYTKNGCRFASTLVNNVLPLWSSRAMFDDDYLQVEVLAGGQAPLEKSTDEILNMTTYTCHICDVEVPKEYWIDHNNGEKHKTCTKILDTALERARKHMNSVTRDPKVIIQVTDTYFCESCSEIVQNFSKIEHETSKKHVRSLKIDDVFKKFSMVYDDRKSMEFDNCTEPLNYMPRDLECMEADFENGMNANESQTVNDNTTEHTKPMNLQTMKSNESNDSLELTKLTDSSYRMIELSDGTKINPITITTNPSLAPATSTPKSTATDVKISKNAQKNPINTVAPANIIKTVPTKAEKKETTQKASTQLDNYLKTVMEKCNTVPIHFVEAFTDKIVIITAINGDKIKVPINNFHSFHNKKEKAFCKICTDPNVGFWHISSEIHMMRLMVPIEDKNGIRKLDDIWSHCILCNDLTKNVDFHLQSVLHKNKLKHALILEGNNVDINENVIKTNTKEIDQTKLIQEHGLIADNESEMTCNICEITIPNKVTSIKNHVETFEHITKYKTTIDNNKLNQLDATQFYCVPCDSCVAKCFALGHCNGKKHCKQLSELLKKNGVEVVDEVQIILPSISQQIRKQKNLQTDSDLICFVCNVVITSVNIHTNTLEHKKNYLAYLEANKLNEIEEDTFYCIPCNTVILIDYLMSHCTSKKHKSLLKNFLNNAETIEHQNESVQTGQLISENSHIARSITRAQESHSVPSTSTQIVSQNGIFETAIPLKFLYQFREMSNSKNLLCTICDEEVLYRKYEIQSHVNIIDHIVAFNLMMLWNKIKKKNDTYYCDVCKVDITYFNELSHITSSQHIDVMEKQPKGTVYEYDRMLLTLEYAMTHKVGDRVRPSSIILQPKNNEKSRMK